ncbi:ISAzo13 family transposase, partial [Candidatus Peregrinibacteria bacterium]|nr:ISAzo13 family transposase [Candidatus Peregrinibacteria bacterium]
MESLMATLEKSDKLIAPHLDERARRLWCASQAQALGHGGVTRVQEATDVSRPRITRGKKDL